MNIFVTDQDPRLSAQVLPDKHIVKMPLECCQMLSIVASDKWGHGYGELHRTNGEPYKTEKGAFRNHPCTKWAAESYEKTAWLIAHGLALCTEYFHRYGKVHSCMKTLFEAKKLFHRKTGKAITCIAWSKTSLAQCQMSLNLTQASTLLLLTKCTLAANLGLHLIIFVTHPANQIGFDIDT